MSQASTAVTTLRSLVRRAWESWATRSLAVGAVATALDVLVLLACVKGLGLSNPAGAVVGVVVGGTFAFFANRYFAFRDRQPGMAKPAVRFVLATLVAIAVHAWMVGLLADRMGVPVVLAKLAADVAVFSVGQLLVLRYIVFPRAEPAAPAAEPLPQVTEASLQ